jgi:hypothetical protein
MKIFGPELNIATEKECKQAWHGGANGKYFRCGLCGHKFKVGDKWVGLFTNGMGKGYGGNPLMCEKCSKNNPEETWKEMCDEFNEKFWFFRRD